LKGKLERQITRIGATGSGTTTEPSLKYCGGENSSERSKGEKRDKQGKHHLGEDIAIGEKAHRGGKVVSCPDRGRRKGGFEAFDQAKVK